VEVDFQEVEVFASPFFKAAFGQLLRDFTGDDIKHLLKVKNLNPVGMSVLRRVIENSRRYFSDKKYRRSIDKVLDRAAANA